MSADDDPILIDDDDPILVPLFVRDNSYEEFRNKPYEELWGEYEPLMFAKRRCLQTIATLRVLHAGLRAGQTAMDPWKKGCVILRTVLWNSVKEWRRFALEFELDWDFAGVESLETLMNGITQLDIDNAKAVELFDMWCLREFQRARILERRAAEWRNSLDSVKCLKRDRKMANRTLKIYQNEAKFLPRAATGNWDRWKDI